MSSARYVVLILVEFLFIFTRTLLSLLIDGLAVIQLLFTISVLGIIGYRTLQNGLRYLYPKHSRINL